ncbi:MAG: hypothetical protein JO133_11335 [Burkholderiaceae bacterium]|nr:hypothetical protein [Burkholderiaceae bacterium]
MVVAPADGFNGASEAVDAARGTYLFVPQSIRIVTLRKKLAAASNVPARSCGERCSGQCGRMIDQTACKQHRVERFAQA